MIYEKKIPSDITVSHDDFKVPHIKIVASETKTPQRTESEKSRRSKKRLKDLSRKISRRKRISRTVAAVLCLCVCFFSVDYRFFGSRALTGICNAVFTDHSDSEQTSPAVQPRTLYTLSYSDAGHAVKSDGVSNIYAIDLQSRTPTENNDSQAVSNLESQSYSDGKYYYPITELDLSSENIYALTNDTSFSINLQSMCQNVPKSLENIGDLSQPLVLILHTHACECYSEYENSYPAGSSTRNENPEKNMVRVGKEIANTLSKFGISSLHCDTLHDKDSFINAYSSSADSVKYYLEKYPSIKFVIDVHRDAVIRNDGESIKATSDFAGSKYAQLMFVVGTNEKGHNHPGWKENLSLAGVLQESIHETYPGLCRNINLRNVPFNQQLSDGYLLLEVGTSANTLDEALRSARAFGQEFARVILSAKTAKEV